MARRKKVVPHVINNWTTSNEYILPNGKIISIDEIIRIDGEHGTRFMFLRHVINNDTGNEWIDCHEIHKGTLGMCRSFRPERIRSISPKKKPRVYKRKKTAE